MKHGHKKKSLFSRVYGWIRRVLLGLVLIFIILAGLEAYHLSQPMPVGLSFHGEWREVNSLRFLSDETFRDSNGQRQVKQEIFDRIFDLIDKSERFILIDMFYFNQFKADPESRPLSKMLVDRLISRKQADPDIDITVISDPINHVYGSYLDGPLMELEKYGVKLVITDLNKLHDSNPLWSMVWRPLISPFGTGEGGAIQNPFVEGRISVRSALKLLNFKANHRKTIVADNGGNYTAIVSSANPHDASWAHTNVAVEFSGAAVLDLLQSESVVLNLSTGEPLNHYVETDQSLAAVPGTMLRVLTEESIRKSALHIINSLQSGDQLKIAMFYFSERNIVSAISTALKKGVSVQILLDPNSESFGRKRIGIPNRFTAWELQQEGAKIRWADTHGEQMHAKMLLAFRQGGEASLLAGSANYTRRNIGGYNLESNVEVVGKSEQPFFEKANALYDRMWLNQRGQYTVEYARYADESWKRRWLMRVQEFSGMGTF